jgi:hypothetical protein
MVTFKPVTTMVWDIRCTPNKRILRIEAGGQMVYDKDCVNHGKVPLTRKEAPLVVPAEVAAGLKAGDTATFSVDERQTPAEMRSGFPKEVFVGSDLKKLRVFCGVAL